MNAPARIRLDGIVRAILNAGAADDMRNALEDLRESASRDSCMSGPPETSDETERLAGHVVWLFKRYVPGMLSSSRDEWDLVGMADDVLCELDVLAEIFRELGEVIASDARVAA